MAMRCDFCDTLHPQGSPQCPARRLGTTVAGKFLLRSILGIGGMATVYGAEHVALKRNSALKIVHVGRNRDSELAARFLREAREMAALGHRGIPAIHDTGVDGDGSPYIEMERLEGETLYALRKREQPLPIPRAIGFVCEILDAVGAIHGRELVHRDLKSPNIFVCRDDEGERIKILDFGFAKAADGQDLTHENELLGTPIYMAPEQILDPRQVDARADIYSLGVITFELLTGRWPLLPGPPREQIRKVVRGDILRSPQQLRPEVPAALDAAVRRALAAERSERFASTTEMTAALRT